MYTLIPAGGTPSTDHPLYPYTQGGPRAMIEINGRPMLQHVLDALDAAETITASLIIGLPETAHPQLTSRKPHHFLPDQGSLILNIFSGLKWLRENRPEEQVVVGCAADLPHVKGHMIDELVELCRPFDYAFYYTVASPELLDGRYPDARRTYATFANGVKVAGGDLFIGRVEMLDSNWDFWQRVIQARKRPWQIARVVGWWTLVKFLCRQLTLEDATATAADLSGKPVKVIQLPYAALAMDGDKPHQIELLRHAS